MVSKGSGSKFFKFNIKRNEDNMFTEIVLGDILTKYIFNVFSLDRDKPAMICEPVKWDIILLDNNEYKLQKYGGFITNDKYNKGFINQINVGKLKLKSKDLINCLNFLGKIKFSINTKLLDFIFYLFKKMTDEF